MESLVTRLASPGRHRAHPGSDDDMALMRDVNTLAAIKMDVSLLNEVLADDDGAERMALRLMALLRDNAGRTEVASSLCSVLAQFLAIPQVRDRILGPSSRSELVDLALGLAVESGVLQPRGVKAGGDGTAPRNPSLDAGTLCATALDLITALFQRARAFAATSRRFVTALPVLAAHACHRGPHAAPCLRALASISRCNAAARVMVREIAQGGELTQAALDLAHARSCDLAVPAIALLCVTALDAPLGVRLFGDDSASHILDRLVDSVLGRRPCAAATRLIAADAIADVAAHSDALKALEAFEPLPHVCEQAALAIAAAAQRMPADTGEQASCGEPEARPQWASSAVRGGESGRNLWAAPAAAQSRAATHGGGSVESVLALVRAVATASVPLSRRVLPVVRSRNVLDHAARLCAHPHLGVACAAASLVEALLTAQGPSGAERGGAGARGMVAAAARAARGCARNRFMRAHLAACAPALEAAFAAWGPGLGGDAGAVPVDSFVDGARTCGASATAAEVKAAGPHSTASIDLTSPKLPTDGHGDGGGTPGGGGDLPWLDADAVDRAAAAEAAAEFERSDRVASLAAACARCALVVEAASSGADASEGAVAARQALRCSADVAKGAAAATCLARDTAEAGVALRLAAAWCPDPCRRRLEEALVARARAKRTAAAAQRQGEWRLRAHAEVASTTAASLSQRVQSLSEAHESERTRWAEQAARVEEECARRVEAAEARACEAERSQAAAEDEGAAVVASLEGRLRQAEEGKEAAEAEAVLQRRRAEEEQEGKERSEEIALALEQRVMGVAQLLASKQQALAEREEELDEVRATARAEEKAAGGAQREAEAAVEEASRLRGQLEEVCERLDGTTRRLLALAEAHKATQSQCEEEAKAAAAAREDAETAQQAQTVAEAAAKEASEAAGRADHARREAEAALASEAEQRQEAEAVAAAAEKARAEAETGRSEAVAARRKAEEEVEALRAERMDLHRALAERDAAIQAQQQVTNMINLLSAGAARANLGASSFSASFYADRPPAGESQPHPPPPSATASSSSSASSALPHRDAGPAQHSAQQAWEAAPVHSAPSPREEPSSGVLGASALDETR